MRIQHPILSATVPNVGCGRGSGECRRRSVQESPPTYSERRKTGRWCIDRLGCWDSDQPRPRPWPAAHTLISRYLIPSGTAARGTHQRWARSGSRMASFRPVSFHKRLANRASSIWYRSLTLRASPRLGFPGVVVRGSSRRKET